MILLKQKDKFQDILLTGSYFKVGQGCITAVTQPTPNLLAVLQHIPTFYAQRCWNHIPLIPKDTARKMLPPYPTSLPFLPVGHFAHCLTLKKKKSVWTQFGPKDPTQAGHPSIRIPLNMGGNIMLYCSKEG